MIMYPALENPSLKAQMSSFEQELYRAVCDAYVSDDHDFEVPVPKDDQERMRLFDAIDHLDKLGILYDLNGKNSVYEITDDVVYLELDFRNAPTERC